MADVAAGGRSSYGLTVESILVPLLTRPRVAQFVKYSVYAALLVNFGYYVVDDYNAYRAALPVGAPLADVVQQFSTTIDTAAWLGLVFLFEIETYLLSDAAFRSWIPKFLLALRLVCYGSIFYAAFGYTAETLEYYDVARVADVDNACQLADQSITIQQSTIDYAEITAENCTSVSDGTVFWRIPGEVAVFDQVMLEHSRFMGWIDVSNAVVWLIVVFLIEVEVFLQASDRFSSRLLVPVRRVSTFFYLVLIGNGVIWGLTGYQLYTWDAFLWIFGFWAIELNLVEWEQDRLKELARTGTLQNRNPIISQR